MQERKVFEPYIANQGAVVVRGIDSLVDNPDAKVWSINTETKRCVAQTGGNFVTLYADDATFDADGTAVQVPLPEDENWFTVAQPDRGFTLLIIFRSPRKTGAR